MISVVILINGQPIIARSAVNRLDTIGKYVADDGTLIEHDPDDGAAALAIKMLQQVQDTPDTHPEMQNWHYGPKTGWDYKAEDTITHNGKLYPARYARIFAKEKKGDDQ